MLVFFTITLNRNINIPVLLTKNQVALQVREKPINVIETNTQKTMSCILFCGMRKRNFKRRFFSTNRRKIVKM